MRLLLVLAFALPLALGARAAPLLVAPTGHPIVPVLVNGRGPFHFVIDTGAEGSAVYDHFAKSEGIRGEPGGVVLEGQTGSTRVPEARLRSVDFDGHVARDIVAAILPDRRDGAPLPGVIGLDLLGSHILEFDIPRGRARLHPAGSAPWETAGGRFEAVRARPLRGGLLALPVTLNGRPGIGVLDTGARDSRINWRFAEAAGLSRSSPALTEAGRIEGATNTALRTLRAPALRMAFGPVRRDGLAMRIVDLPVFEVLGLHREPAMLIGMDALKGSQMFIDFPSSTVWLRGDQPS